MSEPDEIEQHESAAEKVAKNHLLLAVARISMVLALPTITLIATMGSNQLESKFVEIQNKIDLNQSSVSQKFSAVEKAAESQATITREENKTQSELVTKLSDKLIAVETKQTQDAAQLERFQTAVLIRLDRLQDSQVTSSNAISTLTATVQALIEQNRMLATSRNSSPNAGATGVR